MSLPYRQGLIILGMHRSGTSALAGAAVRLGLSGPRTALPASDDNPAGFYESIRVVQVNHQVLLDCGCAWNITFGVWPDQLAKRLDPAGRKLIFKVLHEEFGGDTSFVLKEPRLCLTLPLWLPALQLSGAALRMMVLLRHPVEVMQSLQVRNNLPLSQSMDNWLHHMLEAERQTRQMNRAFVLYNALADDWRRALTQASQQSGMVWPRSLAEAEVEIDSFLKRDARHHAVANHVGIHGAPQHRLGCPATTGRQPA
jgi:hypothetical protein